MKRLGSCSLLFGALGLVACSTGAEGNSDTFDPTFDSDPSSSTTDPTGVTETNDDASETDSTTDTSSTDTTSDSTDTSDTGTTTGTVEECGNGVIEGSEECDGGELGDATCEGEGFGGGGLTCNADCTLNTDNCISCGNGVIDDPSEQCDGADLGANETCFDLSLGTEQEPLGCTADCQYDFGECSGCGDAVITPPEDCEPAGPLLKKDELGDATCMSLGFDDGALACTAGCTFDTSGCYNCGDAVQQGEEPCDGADFNGATCADYMSASGDPYDSGSLTCTSMCEVDTSNCWLCGDGAVTGAEQCEIGVLEGETCISQGFDGGDLGCQSDCLMFDTSACTTCGDGAIEGAEQCDGSNLNGENCVSQGFAGGGTLSCTSECLLDTSACANNFCGDGMVNGGDACDCGNSGSPCTAAQLNNETCISQGFDGGTLACNSPSNCSFDTSGCYSCGDGNVDSGESCDGMNLNGETCLSQGFLGGGTLTCDGSCGFDTSGCIATPNPFTACWNGSVSITGAGPGAANPIQVNIPSMGTVTDVDVSVQAIHTWPGDLIFTLSKGPNSSIFMDQPGAPATTYGCSINDIDASWNDESAVVGEDVCNLNPPGISGDLSPNNPLSVFDGAQMQGNWNLIVDDTWTTGDDGTLTQYCVTVTWN